MSKPDLESAFNAFALHGQHYALCKHINGQHYALCKYINSKNYKLYKDINDQNSALCEHSNGQHKALPNISMVRPTNCTKISMVKNSTVLTFLVSKALFETFNLKSAQTETVLLHLKSVALCSSKLHQSKNVSSLHTRCK